MLKLIIIVLIILIGSALCSATETALLSVSPIKVQQLAQSKKTAALALWVIKKKINRPIATVVIINNIFNIVGSILIGNIAASVFGSTWLGFFSAILTFLVIVFGEIIPKTLGERYAMKFSLIIALPVKGLTFIFTPIVWFMEKITSPFTQGKKLPTTNEAEIMFLTRIGYKEGVIEGDEAEMIGRVFRLNDKSAWDIMTPRIATTYLYSDSIIAEVKSDIISSQHSRIIVIRDSIDDVVGMVLKNELLKGIIEGKENQKVADFMRDIRFIPDTLRVDFLLKEFQKYSQQLMVVLDEYGGVSGVVSLEDVLEELTGEIVDETDQSVDLQIVARMRRKIKLKDK
ncbi:MAG: hemolysin family protein [Trichodesmium sp. St16_bin4-tuft]|uniref:CBS domain containing protein n=1 Tax=Trichodesmium erythraeum (strain IMS101) TaxID=203124 RepID=Q10YX8_TRIEI|nr:HlyC/CorC family transporter [Trichodesmium erythraeum GBRTRLIN201]MCH2049154.1 hemolysin family protein [Trichodesmium sp. ALOHA_ZT_67]MCL2929125.1 hemolysin family protein [Trichodesmium sp. MAG_R01]MDE5072101.1 hemolysin family protein [Trichodesmium sp. St5_bin8]MDE5092536.1 hemolysin family protein [Trichodesmium sp. St18_bin3_1_1]MDE5095077.1 hemolysin family protein [Trichodesmium sp. St11_bin5]MDE5100753.1 hemolysin family protein [Trichodesmium sp. St16_bin4-tuft]MDE5101598.1 hem